MNPIRFSAFLVPLMFAIAPLSASAQVQTLTFQCEQGGSFEAQVEKDQAKVKYASGKTVGLLPVDSREGRKFSDGRTLFYVNGSEAWIEVNYTMVNTQCLAQQAPTTVSTSNNSSGN
ncbi:MAG: hypothetical protein IGS48_24940 [Oscillatoriales cyanobacterium C42_A2020_001]|nr:hypothetical protein [Leptolyngbyaceae cyanobacterium C42_A2020_001]